MQFRSITITNMFSYYGENKLLLENRDSCNITVLIGRNGYGKTSFINSVKMLFVDTAEEIRRTVQRKRTPTPKQFVMGIANEWWGILNQQEKQEGGRKCSIAALWIDDNEYEVYAKREWDLDISYESSLTIEHDMHGLLIDDEAESFLENILPKSFLPFFFFDGEEVQEIAEANDNEIIKKMELLLNIRPLDNMQKALSELARNWKQKGGTASANNDLKSKERELAAKHDQQAIYQQKINDLAIDIEECEDQLKKLDRKLGWLRGGVTQDIEVELKTTIKHKEEQRDKILTELALQWKKDAFLAVHPHLLEKSLHKLEGLIHSNQGEQEELLETVKQRLMTLFTMPPFPVPKLNSNQASFYNRRIVRELEAISVMDCIEDSFDISHDQGKKLFNQLNKYANHHFFSQLKQQTITAQLLWKEIHDLNNTLKSTGTLSKRKQQEYHFLLTEEKKIKESLIQYETDRRDNERKLFLLERSINVIDDELKKLTKALRVATEFRQQHDFSVRLKEALNKVKDRLRVRKRKELEDTYNLHLSKLLDSHGLINKVTIDNRFEVSYRDKQDNEVGMSTISAGMKQLSATALLWALKDISGREFPIIIDTPMGRIDAKHQENLLKNYYPNVGKQVILLPTDSELDARKYKLLKPHICKLYQLSNPTGRSTSIKDSKDYK